MFIAGYIRLSNCAWGTKEGDRASPSSLKKIAFKGQFWPILLVSDFDGIKMGKQCLILNPTVNGQLPQFLAT
ncbi:hypothetical protein GCM10009119_37950 [Algoriphagus jejuensis]|uniref:Uncharacterized protein n=1 Tax=Algoriphagus jejuensis TaxID=419934 RepID=A0ABN1N5B3_9BACT